MIKNLIKNIKGLFGVYEPDHEYRVRLDRIHIKPDFARTTISKAKFKRKRAFYYNNGYCESKIILNRNFELVDGYSSYVLLKAYEGSEAKVPVWFVD